MEKSYKFTITTMDGEEKEIDVLHLTLRHGLRLHSLKTDASIEEVLLDMLAPGGFIITHTMGFAPHHSCGCVPLTVRELRSLAAQAKRNLTVENLLDFKNRQGFHPVIVRAEHD